MRANENQYNTVVLDLDRTLCNTVLVLQYILLMLGEDILKITLNVSVPRITCRLSLFIESVSVFDTLVSKNLSPTPRDRNHPTFPHSIAGLGDTYLSSKKDEVKYESLRPQELGSESELYLVLV